MVDQFHGQVADNVLALSEHRYHGSRAPAMGTDDIIDLYGHVLVNIGVRKLAHRRPSRRDALLLQISRTRKKLFHNPIKKSILPSLPGSAPAGTGAF
jgi:hypothetical protein